MVRRIILLVLVSCCTAMPLNVNAVQGASRLISLKPNITEIIFALGSGDHLVGVTTYCKRPEVAKKLLRVADYIRADPEKILFLKPDLILGSKENSSQKEIQFLQGRGLRVELLSFDTLASLRSSIQKIGELLKTPEQAQHLIKQLDQGLARLNLQNASNKNKPKPKTLLVVGYDPLVVVGGNNFIDEVFSLINLENVAQESRFKYPTYSIEQVIGKAPELILDLSMAVPTDSPEFQKNFQERLEWWRRFPSIPAVRQNKIIPIDIEEIRAVPSLSETLERVKIRLDKVTS